jgi:hypothetical protein
MPRRGQKKQNQKSTNFEMRDYSEGFFGKDNNLGYGQAALKYYSSISVFLHGHFYKSGVIIIWRWIY